MKKLSFEDLYHNGKIEFVYDRTDCGYSICLRVENEMFSFVDNINVPIIDMEDLYTQYVDFVKGTCGVIKWQDDKNRLAVLIENNTFYSNLQCTLEIKNASCRIVSSIILSQGYFQKLEFTDICSDDDFYMPINEKNVLRITKTNQRNDSIDFSLFLKNSCLELRKEFWLYDFELLDIKRQINSYVKKSDNIDIDISDSFLRFHLQPNNTLVIETNDYLIPQSFVSVSIKMESSSIHEFFDSMIS